MNTPQPVKKIGIVGFGFAGELHAEAFTAVAPQSNIFVYDTKREALARAEAKGYSVCRGIGDLVRAEPEIFIVAVPPAYNESFATTIANLKHKPRGVLFEKPLALSVYSGERIANLMSRAGIFSMVGLTGHFHPEFQLARAVIRHGTLGKVTTYMEKIHQGGHAFPPRYVTKEYGGAVYELGVHALDHLCYLSGNDRLVILSARGGRNHWNNDALDWCDVCLLANGQRLLAYTSWAFTSRYEMALERGDYTITIVGTKGKMVIYGFDRLELTTSTGTETFSFHDKHTPLRERHLPGFCMEAATFLRAVTFGEPSPVSLGYALTLQRLLEKIDTAAHI